MTMTYTDIRYGILLSNGQLDFLRDDQQGFHRAEALATFVKMAAIEPSHYAKKNFEVDLDIGQFLASTVELATLWGCDRKTAAKVVRMFNDMGILTSEANNRTTVHAIHCLAFWLGKDGNEEKTIKNPHYTRYPVIKSVSKAEASGEPTGVDGQLKADSITERKVDNTISNDVCDTADQSANFITTVSGVQRDDRSKESRTLHDKGTALGNQVVPIAGFPISDHGADTIGTMKHEQLAANLSSLISSNSDTDSHAAGDNIPDLGNDHVPSNTSSAYPDSHTYGRQAIAEETSISSEHGI